MTHDVVLRPAADAETEAVAVLWHAGWRDGHLGHAPEALLAHRDEDSFRERVPPRIPHTTVAEVDGRVVGFVTVLDDELEQVYVAADARGTGVAAQLMEHGERIVAAEHAVAWLAVATGNARARRFYERSGWHDTGEIDYEAETADGTFLVPCRRYEKDVTPIRQGSARWQDPQDR